MAKKNKKNCYEFGSFVKANASGIGSAGQFAAGALDTFKNPNKANIGLSAGQGALSGAAAGAALGPLGMAGGALIGGISGLVGGIKQKQQIDNQRDATYGDLRGQQANGMTTTSVNPYGTQIYADGGKVQKNKPIYVSDPNDPRLKSYKDSLYLHTLGNELNKVGKGLEKFIPIKPGSKWDEVLQKSTKGNKGLLDNTNVKGVNPKIKAFMNHYQKNGNKGILPERYNGYIYDPSQGVIDMVTGKAGLQMLGLMDQGDTGATYKLPQWKKPNQPVTYKKPVIKKAIINNFKTSVKNPVNKVNDVETILTEQPVLDFSQVEKADGSVGMWGNPISVPNPVNVTKNNPIGYTDHRGVRSGPRYQGTPANTKAVEAKEKMLKAQSSRNYYADGSDVEQNIINIEKGELQIDTNSGKILREYKGVNPESAGLYQPHAKKGKDTNHNFVTADPGTFIITKAKAGKYKKAIDNNDKLAQQSILQNIRNYKSTVENGTIKFAGGSDVPVNTNPYLPNKYLGTMAKNYGQVPVAPFSFGSPIFNPNVSVDPKNWQDLSNEVPIINSTLPLVNTKGSLPLGTGQVKNVKVPGSYTPPVKQDTSNSTLDNVSKYGAAAFNIARGMFGKAEQERLGTKISNPYLNQIQANMPQDIDMQPIYNDIYSQQRVGVQDLRNNSNNSAVYRANRQNINANTQRQISGARLQGQMANNQIRGQRSSIYAGLGAQDMQEQQRLQQYNLGINQINAQNRGAKQNLLGTGLSQLQQVNQNDKFNAKQYEMQMMQYKLLPEIFQNWKYYQDSIKIPKP